MQQCQINYLGNTGPANAKKISDIVTRIGPLGSIAGLASGEIAAMGATIAGMGVESESASTGIKNFMLSLTKGGAVTASQKKALKRLGLNPKELASSMQKDSKGTILNVLDSIARLPKDVQAPLMTSLFGSESIAAIAPLLANLDLLPTNFKRVGGCARVWRFDAKGVRLPCSYYREPVNSAQKQHECHFGDAG